jgi:hypothetical protein
MPSINAQPMLHGPLLHQKGSLNVASGYESKEWQSAHEHSARDMSAAYTFIHKEI